MRIELAQSAHNHPHPTVVATVEYRNNGSCVDRHVGNWSDKFVCTGVHSIVYGCTECTFVYDCRLYAQTNI